MRISSYRFWLAALVVTITPGTLPTWAHLRLAGYTYNEDGSRNVGHLEKAIPTDIAFAIATGVLVLAIGFLAVLLASRNGKIAAPRLLAVASGIGAALGLLATSGLLVVYPGTRSAFNVFGLVPLVTAVTVTVSVLLCLEFILVSGAPLRALDAQVPGQPSKALTRLAGQAIQIVAAIYLIAALAWFAQLWTFAIQHPCSCG